ncbi:MAG: DinB family protein [Anaerolineae bacterium]
MEAIAAQLEAEVHQVFPILAGMAESLVSQATGPEGWSRKQIVGHLIDSAANNHQKIVRTAQASSLTFPPYDQEFWAQFQGYQQADWSALVELWRFYNLHLAFVIRRLTEAALAHECTIGTAPPVTLAWLVSDYLRHVRHHLDDLLRPLTKTELLERIETGRLALAETLNRLSEAECLRPDAHGWSIKDHLAHLAAWEMSIVALLRRQPRWAAMGLDEATLADADEETENNYLYQLHRDRSLTEVMAYFEDVHHQMVAVLATLNDEDLHKPCAHYDPNEAKGNADRPVLGWIIGNTYEHYAEHKTWIEAINA